MNKTLLFIAVLIITTDAWAQGCLPEGISFQSQAAVDSFQFNYPGCTMIEGGVWINGGVFNLHGLSVLKSIGGDLSLNCVPLSDLSGLDSLTYIGGNLGFWDTELVDMTGLGSLDSIGGSFLIGCETNTGIFCNNPHLINFTGLVSLSKIGGTLLVQHCASLSSMDGLSSLASAGGMVIKSNPVLASLTGLANVDAGSVSSLTISNNASLSQCNVQSICNYLGNPGGDVNIYGNAVGCRNPVEVADSCGFTLSCLPFGNYWLKSQSDIENFQSNYVGCTSLAGNVYIIGSDITNLNGLDSVTSVGGSLVIGHEWLGGGNPNLQSLGGLENITSIGNGLRLQYNSLLENLAGLQSLDSIGGYMQLIYNDAITSLSGIENLAFIGGGLEISGMDALVNLSGLQNVTTVTGNILIRLNDFLISLSGLDNIDPGSVDGLSVYSNDQLSSCAIQSICEYLVSPGGEVNISWNASGCNSPEEVIAACQVGDEEIPENHPNTICPNPTSDIVSITLPAITGQGQLSLFNTTGQEIICQPVSESTFQLSLSSIPAGVYFVRITGEKKVWTGKIIKE